MTKEATAATAAATATKRRTVKRRVNRATVAATPAPDPTPDQVPAEPATGVAAVEAAMSRQLLDWANAERALRGVPALQWDDGLASLAKNWSQTMSSTQNFTHRPKGATAGFNVPTMCCWENIYYVGGTAMSTSRLHDGWMRSTGHRNNILSPEVTFFGAGVVCGGNGKSYATQNFGTTHWKGIGTPQTAAEPRIPLPAGDVVCP